MTTPDSEQPTLSPATKVLFVTRKWPPAVGGMETYSTELCTELRQLVSLTTRALPGRPNGYPPHPISLLRFMLTTAAFLLLRGRRYDVVHFGDLVLFPLAWLHAIRHPHAQRVLTVHGLDLIYGNRGGWGPTLYRVFLNWASRCSDTTVNHYIANSRNTACLADDLGFKPVRPIPLGVQSHNRPPAPSPLGQPPYILFVGRLVPRKGAAWFASNVLPRLPEALTFHVVGVPWDQEETQTLRDNPRVRLLGYLDKASLDRERAECMAIVMPNRSSPDRTDVEGFGIAALEAARDGVPVLASAIEGITDAVIDGETGFLLPENDVAAWECTLQRIRAWTPAQRAAYARNAIDTVAARYTWHCVARATVDVYLSRPA